MTTVAKELMFKEITDAFDSSPYAFVSTFKALPVDQMMVLRIALEKVSKRTMVVKHSLAKKIFDEKKYTTAENFLNDSVMITFTDDNPQDASKALAEFAKSCDKLVPAGVIFEGKVYEKSFVTRLSTLPGRQQLLTQIAVTMNSPITGLARTLGAITKGLVVALNAVKEKKEAGAQAGS